MNPVDTEDYKMSGEEMNYHIIGVVLSQKFNLRYGLKKFGKSGEKANANELTKFHDMTTFIPLDPMFLTREDIIKTLS